MQQISDASSFGNPLNLYVLVGFWIIAGWLLLSEIFPRNDDDDSDSNGGGGLMQPVN